MLRSKSIVAERKVASMIIEILPQTDADADADANAEGGHYGDVQRGPERDEEGAKDGLFKGKKTH